MSSVEEVKVEEVKVEEVKVEEAEDEVEVSLGGTEHSNAKISTNDLGPCIAFLLTFKYEDKNTAVLTHYVHSKKKKEKYVDLSPR